MKRLLACLLFAVAVPWASASPEVVPLWPEGVPGAQQAGAAYPGDDRASTAYAPTLTVYRPAIDHANGTAVIICPGGGYVGLAVDHEGTDYARALNDMGVTAFVLRYRVRARHPAPLLDVLRAMRLVRSEAGRYHIRPDRIGIIGSSAGGHLAASAGTLFDHPLGRTGADLDKVSARPDFLMLVYPVITMTGPNAHAGSRRQLLGAGPTEEDLRLMSVEMQVTGATPPTLLVHTQQDRLVPVENSILFYQALTRAGVPAEMYLFERGAHGIGMRSKLGTTSAWPVRVKEWLAGKGFLD
ncbi:alpha/beta hydrolase [Massilia orientalis]|uniref:Alpha/beta hydrolase n=1 Tax=Massilia orientalis TaxID=3050128 RepID=A0ACC7MHZ8_9BURK|nr:alpha/beta hydrolase [Massilia sp. YIM B02787]